MNGTPPSEISQNISYQASLAIPGVKVIVQELPRINFIWQFRIFFRIIGETVTAYHIGKLKQWDHLLSVGRGRRQTDIHNLFIGIIDEELLHPLILSTSIILEVDLSSRLNLFCQPLRDVGSGCSIEWRFWSVHTLHTRIISQTRTL